MVAALSFTGVILAAGLGAAALAFAYLAVRHSVAAVAVVMAAWIAAFALRDVVDLSVSVSGTRVFPLDVLSAVLVGVAVVRAFRDRDWNIGRILAFILLGIVVVHVLRGVADSGLQTGFNYGRSWIYFTAGMVYAATVPGGWNRDVWKVVIGASVALTVLSIPYFIADGVLSSSSQIVVDGELINWRPIVATGALVILQGAVLAIALGWPSKRAAIGIAAAAGVVTLLLQHRTVWIAAALIGVIALIAWALRQERTRAVVAVGTALVLLAVPLGVVGFTKADALVDSIEEPTSDDSTFAWRTDVWSELLEANDSPAQIAIGNPSGQGWNERFIDGSEVDIAAHNELVDAYVRFGLVGVALVCALGVVLWVRRDEVGSPDRPPGAGGRPAAAHPADLQHRVLARRRAGPDRRRHARRARKGGRRSIEGGRDSRQS